MPAFVHRGKKYENPVELALDVIGGKWKMPILWRLKEQNLRYAELRRSLGPGVRDKTLAEQLREMESDGLISRKVHPTNPPQVEYCITELGMTTIPSIETLRAWGSRFKAATTSPSDGPDPKAVLPRGED
ncbi:transcriptional regulator [bacterium]|nr:transcriptional regulator [bacterium]